MTPRDAVGPPVFVFAGSAPRSRGHAGPTARRMARGVRLGARRRSGAAKFRSGGGRRGVLRLRRRAGAQGGKPRGPAATQIARSGSSDTFATVGIARPGGSGRPAGRPSPLRCRTACRTSLSAGLGLIFARGVRGSRPPRRGMPIPRVQRDFRTAQFSGGSRVCRRGGPRPKKWSHCRKITCAGGLYDADVSGGQ